MGPLFQAGVPPGDLGVLTGHVSRYGSSGSITCRQCLGTHVQRIADGFWREYVGVRAKAPHRPYRVAQVFEGHVEADPIIRLRLLGADSSGILQQFLTT